jgi:hypothetical protein
VGEKLQNGRRVVDPDSRWPATGPSSAHLFMRCLCAALEEDVFENPNHPKCWSDFEDRSRWASNATYGGGITVFISAGVGALSPVASCIQADRDKFANLHRLVLHSNDAWLLETRMRIWDIRKDDFQRCDTCQAAMCLDLQRWPV